MQTAEEGNTVVVKLVDGEDLFTSLESACRAHRIESGAVVSGIGMLQAFELGFFGPDGYERRSFAERHELVGLHGSITMRGDPKFHLHAALGQRDHSVIGGHLFRGTVAIVNELVLVRFTKIRMNRQRNPKTTLNELVIE